MLLINDPVIGSGTLAESYDLSIDAGAVLTINSGGSLTMSGTLTNNAGDVGFIIGSGASFIHFNCWRKRYGKAYHSKRQQMAFPLLPDKPGNYA